MADQKAQPRAGIPARRDERLIDLFLRGYKDREGNSYRLAERPDHVERGRPAIDCVAVNERGDTLAIEHTLVEPFQGQKADDQPFLAVFDRLHHSQELAVPNLLIDVLVPVGAIPRGVDWNDIGERVVSWFRDVRLRIPVGESDHNIPNLGFDLTVHIDTMEIPATPGGIVTGRLRPRGKPFCEVLQRALAAKLPKLAAALADNRILLVEDASMILGMTIFSREIDAAQDAFPQLARIDSVWLARTAVWVNNVVWFFHMWPNGVRDRFKIEDA